MISRRQFLRTSAVAAAAPMLLTRQRSARAQTSLSSRKLVLVELSGGNDALNTLIPVSDPLYYSQRPTLAIPPAVALMLTDHIGLHPAMAPLHRLYERRELAIIQGVGYPKPSRSHFRSMEIWHGGDLVKSADGWLGRCRHFVSGDAVYAGEMPPEVFASVSDTITPATRLVPSSQRISPIAYPPGHLADALASFAALIARDAPARFFHVSQSGFDTHARQDEFHPMLLADVSTSVAAFFSDLRSRGRDREVLVMIFSEFGRRLRENSSAGTDHGAAGILMVAGPSVRGGLFGAYPSLSDLDDGDLKHTTDFRDCYAAIAQRWLGISARPMIAHPRELVPFI